MTHLISALYKIPKANEEKRMKDIHSIQRQEKSREIKRKISAD